MKYEPWAKLMMRITPKISESPLARRKRSAPYDTPLNIWTTQKSTPTPSLAQAHWEYGARDEKLRVRHVRGARGVVERCERMKVSCKKRAWRSTPTGLDHR